MTAAVTQNQTRTVRYQVAGMDYSSCAEKTEGAAHGFDGLSNQHAPQRDGRFACHRLVALGSSGQALRPARVLPDPGGWFGAGWRRFRDRMWLRESGRCRIGIQTASLTGIA